MYILKPFDFYRQLSYTNQRMDQEIESKIDESLSLARENRKILKKLLAYERQARIYAILRWVIFFVITLSLYYYLQPYLEQLTDIYVQMNEVVGGFGFPSFGE